MTQHPLMVDSHLDLAWNALQWNRNLIDSVYTIRAQEDQTPSQGRGQGTVALPELRQGRVALCFATCAILHGNWLRLLRNHWSK